MGDPENKNMLIASTNLCAENLMERCDGSIQRKNISEILDFGNQGKLVNFAWGSEILPEKISFKSFKMKEHHESFPIPISRQNIGMLKEMSECRLSLRPTWEIDASKICISTFKDFNLSSLVVHNLQLPEEMEVTAKCTKLVLYDGEKCFIHNLSSCWIEGKFGTATLQLPVEGGHEGGSLNVEYGGRKKKFESHKSSNAVFYLSAFFDSCEHFIEPVLQGYKLVLVYDLLWTNAKTGIPKNFPLFLGAMKKIKESLEPWLQNQLLNSKIKNENRENSKVELETPATASVIHRDSSEVINRLKKRKNSAITERTLTENVFLFVLQESYDEKILAFELLRGQDRVFADLLLNCDFLDVHLAMASQSSSTNIIERAELIEVTRVIDSDDVTRNLSIQLKWENNVVGIIQQSDKERKVPNEKSEEIPKIGKINLPRGVLLIWPKHHSVQMYCRYGLHSLLIRMGKSLTSLAKWKDHTRAKAIGDLSQLVSYCCAEPRKVWTKSGMKKGELTLKLLHFCITLRAPEEGLDLLKILSSNFDDDSQDAEVFEGIQTEDVAQAIANFERQVCGWSEIAELIKAMVKPSRIVKQLIPITKLVKFFLDVDCIEGAKTVGDCIFSWFDEMHPSLAWKSKYCDVEAFINLLVALQSNPETFNRKRIASFFLFFSKLRPSLQFRLLLNFESQHGLRLKSIQSWQFIYRDACEIFSLASNTNMPPLKCMAVDFMKAIEVWISELTKEAVLRPELQESLEPEVVLTDPVLDQSAAASVSQKSYIPSVELNPENNSGKTEWTTASDEWASATSTQIIAAASETRIKAGTFSTDDWGGTSDSLTTDSKRNELTPRSCASLSTDDWDSCADAWTSTGKISRTVNKAISKDDQSSWDVPRKIPAPSNSNTTSDDWNSWSSTAPKPNLVTPSSGNDDWSSADAWGSSKGTSKGSSQSDGWGNAESTQSSWTGGYNASRGGERKQLRPCFKCNEEGHMSYNCPTDPNRGRGGGRGGGRGRGGSTRTCYKCSEDGHVSYNCPTGPTRGRGGGSTRPCFKCNQDGHLSYNCPNASTGGRGTRYSPASSYGTPSSNTGLSTVDNWGTLTVTPDTKSSSFDSGEKKNDWGSASDKASRPWASGANAAPRDARNTPRSSYNARCGYSQPVLDDWGIASNSSAAPPVSITAGISAADDWGSAADAWSSVKTAKSTPLHGTSTALNSGVDDWGLAADAWSTVNTAKSTQRSGNGSAVKSGGDDWGAVADSWDDLSSGSNPVRGPRNNSTISRTGPIAIVKSGEDDWGVAADVSKRGSVSNAKAKTSIPEINDWNDSGAGKGNDPNYMTNSQELSQQRIKPAPWNGTINHGRRSFKADLKSSDVNNLSVLDDLEMPKSMRVVGTIEPGKVWTYLRRVSETISERIGVFHFIPATNAEIDGYKFFYDELNGMNWFAVIADAPDSKLPWSFKDFYVVPLAKESPVPLELTPFVKKSFRENRKSDFILGVVVFRAQRTVDQTIFTASVPEKKAVCVTQSDAESESIGIQEIQNSESTLVASAQPPTRMTAIRQKLQQDILSVDPVKAKIQSNSSQLKSSLSRAPSVAKSIPVVSSPAVAESIEDSSPVKTTPVVNVPFNLGQPPVDGEMLMQKAILEELSRQIGASKHGKSTEAIESVLSIAVSGLKSTSSSGHSTRSRSKRKPVVEESSASKRSKNVVASKESNLPFTFKEKEKLETESVQKKAHISSRKGRSPSASERRQCVVDGCSGDAQTNSVYCSEECIANHVRDSLNAMSEKIKSSQLQEPQSPINSLTPPSTSSDESLWKDSVDYSLLMSQPTPALASKLLTITQRRKSLSSGGANKPLNLADDTPVPVVETKTGKVLLGPSAPKVANVEQWLKDNATYEIMKPESLPDKPWSSIPSTTTASSSKVADSKTSPVHTSSTSPISLKPKAENHSSKKPSDLSSSKSKMTRKRSTEVNNEEETPTKMAKSDPETTRSISRSSLKEALWSRCKESNDLETEEAIVEQVAKEIEDSLFSLFKHDVGAKYKNKYRSLIFNIKDPKNPGLFREIITKHLLPDELVKMSTEDLANKDLAEWREKEAKHQLDLIEKNEQAIMGLANRYLIKTHKGEEVIEDVYKELDDREEIASKKNIASPLTPECIEGMTPVFKSRRLDRSRNSSNHSIKENDRNNSASSRSVGEKCDKMSSRSSKSSRRDSNSSSKRSGYHRSDRDKKKDADAKERDHHRSSSSRGKHHKANSDRHEKREKKRKEDIPEPAKSSNIKKTVDVAELYDPSNPLNSDEVHISVAAEDELLLKQKLSMQEAVLDELNRQNESPKPQWDAEVAVINSAAALLLESGDTEVPEIAESTTSLNEVLGKGNRQYRLLTDYSDDENGVEKKPEGILVFGVDKNSHQDLEIESDLSVATVGCRTGSFPVGDEEHSFCSPGKLLIAEDEESILDFDEQIINEQNIIEELNSNLTSFIVNNLHIQSHDADLDASASSEMVTSEVNESGVSGSVDLSTSSAISCMNASNVSSSLDPVFDQSTQSTSSGHLEDPVATAEHEEN